MQILIIFLDISQKSRRKVKFCFQFFCSFPILFLYSIICLGSPCLVKMLQAANLFCSNLFSNLHYGTQSIYSTYSQAFITSTPGYPQRMQKQKTVEMDKMAVSYTCSIFCMIKQGSYKNDKFNSSRLQKFKIFTEH